MRRLTCWELRQLRGKPVYAFACVCLAAALCDCLRVIVFHRQFSWAENGVTARPASLAGLGGPAEMQNAGPRALSLMGRPGLGAPLGAALYAAVWGCPHPGPAWVRGAPASPELPGFSPNAGPPAVPGP